MKAPRAMISRWKALAVPFHAHFGLDANGRREALICARLHPTLALRCYQSIAASLTPHLPARST